MRKTIYCIGSVIKGELEGLNVYIRDADSFVIIRNDNRGKLSPGNMIYKEEQIISLNTVDRYEDVSSAKNGPDFSSMATGAILFGPVGALIGAAATNSAVYDVAVKFKNGKKSLIRLNSTEAYQEFKKIMF